MKTLFILHGWQSSKEKWQKVKEGLEKGGTEVIVPDLPGFKKENELRHPWDLDNYAEWFRDFSSNKEKFFLLGHSFGGRIAIKFSVKYPEKLNGLILVSSAGIKHKKTLWRFFISIAAKICRRFSFLPFFSFWRMFFYRFVLRKTDYLLARGNLEETFKKVIAEDLTPQLSQVNIPTLIIWGRNDKITPLKDAYLMKEKIHNSRLEILDNVRHTPHLENPKLFSQHILEFISHVS